MKKITKTLSVQYGDGHRFDQDFTFPQYESMQEAINDKGEQVLLDFINSMVERHATSVARAEAFKAGKD